MKVIKIPFTHKIIVDEHYIIEKELYQHASDKTDSLIDAVLSGRECNYTIRRGVGVYAVCVSVDNFTIPIKSFPFGDDEQYAKLCAEELCDLLSDNY